MDVGPHTPNLFTSWWHTDPGGLGIFGVWRRSCFKMQWRYSYQHDRFTMSKAYHFCVSSRTTKAPYQYPTSKCQHSTSNTAYVVLVLPTTVHLRTVCGTICCNLSCALNPGIGRYSPTGVVAAWLRPHQSDMNVVYWYSIHVVTIIQIDSSKNWKINGTYGTLIEVNTTIVWTTRH